MDFEKALELEFAKMCREYEMPDTANFIDELAQALRRVATQARNEALEEAASALEKDGNLLTAELVRRLKRDPGQ